ncbi:MAG: WD40/YVTN/BNR-like repeat-containing protein [Omnitrophica WOR_2 bacterium]
MKVKPPMKLYFNAVLAGVLACLFALSGCVPTVPAGPGTSPTGEASPSPLAATPAMEDTPIPTPLNPVTPTLMVTATGTITGPVPGLVENSGQQPVQLTSLHMVSDSAGWSTGTIAGRCEQWMGCVLYSDNGGKSWKDVTPPAIGSGTVDAAYFLDANTAWIASASVNPGSVSMYRTTDAGGTWETNGTLSIASGGPGWLYFLDARHGWMMANLGGGAGSNAVEIWGTSDGEHWQKLSGTDETPNPPAGSLPLSCDKAGIGFLDNKTGWVSGDCPGGSIFFYVTNDGGKTWQSQALTPPPGYPSTLFNQCQCSMSAPKLIAPQFGAITINIFDVQPAIFLYVTRDGGKTWQPEKLPVSQLSGNRVDFINPNTAWITDGSQLYLTQDTGKTWSKSGTRLPTTEMLGELNFVSATHGWVTDGANLYETLDAGHTWSTIQPAATEGSASGTPSALSSGVVTRSQNQQTIALSVGQEFLLNLGEGFDWTVTVDNQAVLSRKVNVTVIRGAQGIYVANQAGTATLQATGDPVCRQAKPACMAPSILFEIKVVVK